MVYVLLADGFEEIEALYPVDLLRRAGAQVTLLSVSSSLTVTGAHGITVQADALAKDTQPKEMQLLFLPGGMPGSRYLDESPETDRFLSCALAEDARISAICAAPMVLGKRGLLQGRKATCFPGFEQELQGATVLPQGVVKDGNILTAAGMGWAEELGLELVSELFGAEKAKALASAIAPHGKGTETWHN